MTLNRRLLLPGAAFGASALMMTRIALADAPAPPLGGDMAKLFITGGLPGVQRLYALSDGQGEYHLVGG